MRTKPSGGGTHPIRTIAIRRLGGRVTQRVQEDAASTWWLRRLVGYLAPHRRKLITAFAAAMVVMATTALLPLIIRSTASPPSP